MPDTQREAPTCNCGSERDIKRQVVEAVADALLLISGRLDEFGVELDGVTTRDDINVGQHWYDGESLYKVIGTPAKNAILVCPPSGTRSYLPYPEFGKSMLQIHPAKAIERDPDPVAAAREKSINVLHCEDCSRWKFAGIWTQEFCLPQEQGDCAEHDVRRARKSIVCDRFDRDTPDEE